MAQQVHGSVSYFVCFKSQFSVLHNVIADLGHLYKQGLILVILQ
jgi:hypothetical protein